MWEYNYLFHTIKTKLVFIKMEYFYEIVHFDDQYRVSSKFVVFVS
jgi:hypothetical protein